MKKIFFLFIFSLLILNCNKKSIPKKNIENVISDSKLIRKNNIYYVKETNKKYTGKARFFSEEFDRTLIAECSIVNGILHGPLKAFNQNGFLQNIFYYDNNMLLVKLKEYNDDNLLKSEINNIKDNKYKINFYHDNGNLAMSYEATSNNKYSCSPNKIYDFKRSRIRNCFFTRNGVFQIYSLTGNIVKKVFYKDDKIIKNSSL